MQSVIQIDCVGGSWLEQDVVDSFHWMHSVYWLLNKYKYKQGNREIHTQICRREVASNKMCWSRTAGCIQRGTSQKNTREPAPEAIR